MSELDEKLPDESVTLISKQTEKARNKLFFFCLFIIFYGVYQPTLTGFLGTLSIEIRSHADSFFFALMLVTFWLYMRYAALLSKDSTSVGISLNPFKAIYSLANGWSSTIEHETDKELEALNNQIEKHYEPGRYDHSGDPEVEERQERIEIEFEQQVEHLKQKKINAKKTDQNRNRAYKQLVFMDIGAPLVAFTFSMAILLFQNSEFLVTEHSQNIQNTYTIEKATLEVKNIKLKQTNP